MTVEDLERPTRERLVATVCSLADTKLLLGYRYNERVYGAPSMEDANAIQGQAANEFGQAKHFLSVAEGIHGGEEDLTARSDPDAYYNMSILDESPDLCPAFLATIGFADVATQVRLQSLEQGDWSPLAEPAGKAIQEEEFHTQYLIGAIKAYVLPDNDAREIFKTSFRSVFPEILRWFGPDDDAAEALGEAGILSMSPETERELLIERLAEIDEEHFENLVPADALEGVEQVNSDGWDERRMRPPGGPAESAVEALSIDGIEASLGLDG